MPTYQGQLEMETIKKAQLEKKKKAEASKKAAPKKAVKAEKTTEKSV